MTDRPSTKKGRRPRSRMRRRVTGALALVWLGGALGVLGLVLTGLGLFAPHAVHLIAVM